MAKGHLYLVLAVLLGAGPVLAINVDLREQELQTQQELNLAVSRELGDVVDQAELISIKELNVSRVDSRGKKEKKNCKENGGWCRLECEYQEAPFKCSRTHKCCLPPKSCVFGGSVWPHDSYLTEACFDLQCKDGIWKYKGNNTAELNTPCGECKVEGDPHIFPYDELPIQIPSYLVNTSGEYIVTQYKLKPPFLFRVEANFDMCINRPGWHGACISKVTYHEPGISVTLALPPSGQIAWDCVQDLHHPNRNTDCDIKVLVNGIPVRDLEKGVFGGFGGPILVFKHNHITKSNDLICMSIVGTKGLSVTLCEVKGNYPYMYIWALPSLESEPPLESTLEGLCNTWTGSITTGFTLKDGTVKPWNTCLFDGDRGYYICDEFTQSWTAG